MAKVLGAKVVWGLRASNVDFANYDRLAEWSFRFGASFSRFPDLIIVNSWAGKQHHIAHGYCGDRMMVIPNGIDTEHYRPDREAGRHVRAEWGVAEDELLVGLVGRLDPMKDHTTFLRATALVTEERSDVRFVCAGDGPEQYRRELLALGESLGLGARLIWAGARSDMPAVYNAFDMAVSSSYGEGFPNAVGEAMACGVPCVVTDVGDSARIVGETGIVVPARSPEALAIGILRLLTSPERCERGEAARLRIREMFSRERLLEATQAALSSMVQ
jgi:glycosyltransferase involved in cell wall biosynthesis